MINLIYYNKSILHRKKRIELFLKPRLIYNDPFRVKGSVIALWILLINMEILIKKILIN